MAGRDFSGLLGRQKRQILRMICDQPPEPKRQKVEDFKEPRTTDVPGVLLPKDGDLSLENRNKRMFKQLVGTLERFRKEDGKLPGTEARMRSLDSLKRIEDGISDVDVIEVAAKNDSAEEQTVRGVNVSHDDSSKTWLRTVGDERPRMRDTKAPPAVHFSRVLQKYEDPSLVNRNKRMFRQLLGNLEANSNAEYQFVPKRRAVVKIEDGKNVDDIELKDDQDKDSAVDECVMGVGTSQNERTATWHRNEVEPLINYSSAKSLGADVPLTEKRKEQAKEKSHEESEWPRQNTNEQIAENGTDLTVSTRVAATAGKDLKVHHSKLRRFLRLIRDAPYPIYLSRNHLIDCDIAQHRTKVEPPIEYSFAISSDADVPSIEQRNEQGFAQIGRKASFVHIENIGGKEINILQGLELYTNVFGPDKQKEIVNCIYELQKRGQNGQLRGRTYSEPKKWMQGKGRITIQFGCCYNYATDRNGNPPGVLRNEEVEPLPMLFKEMIKNMVMWQIISTTCVPDSCIVNIYEVGDCIPPHIDHHDFLRPFCTVSFLAECKILFGSNLEIVGPGKFKGPVSIPLPVGSVLIINGNGADIAKHCVPGVHDKRISITFRKMDQSKLPYNIFPDP